MKGNTNETPFPSLMALIYQHSLTKMSLPVELVIPLPPGNYVISISLIINWMFTSGKTPFSPKTSTVRKMKNERGGAYLP